MKALEISFRIAVVALLAVIALELGGYERIAAVYHSAKREVRSLYVRPEEPAAGGGVDAMFQGSTNAVIEYMARHPENAASSPGQ